MSRHNLKHFLLPVLTGIAGYACFPKADQGYLAWVGLIPLILFFFRSARVGRAFLGGIIAGGLQSFGLLIWMPAVLIRYGDVPRPLAWLLYLLLALLLGCYTGIVCATTRFCMNRRGDRYLWLFPPAWITLEYFQNFFIFGGFPWLLIGYSQTNWTLLAQIADVTGVLGVSFLILWINTSLVWAWVKRKNGAKALLPLVVGSAMVVGCLLYGDRALRRWHTLDAPLHLHAALVQPNLALDRSDPPEVYEPLIGSLNSVPVSVDLVVLPEAPSAHSFESDSVYRESLRRLARRFPLGMILNNIADEDGSGASRYFNSTYFLNSQGREIARYDKIHLVPFGEYVPLRRLFFFAESVTKDVGEFSEGKHYVTAEMGGHRLNAVICFEAAFAGLVRQFIQEGSQLIVNQTDDGWYGDSAAPYQHLAIARWRAIENRRYLLRAANSGISAVIEPTGELQSSTGLFQAAVCRGLFGFVSERSIYTRCGDCFAFLCVIITCLFAVISWLGGNKVRQSCQPSCSSENR